jgi:uncharacterized protein (DUF305 family)
MRNAMKPHRHSAGQSQSYYLLGSMTVLMFVAMYGLMYAMVDRWANVFANINQVYMAGLMTAPMVAIELAVMRHMYPSRTANLAVLISSLAVLALCWFGIRQQWLVTDNQFLRSMIPHHAGALLMCEEAPIERSEIRALCSQILEGQRAEIALMKELLPKS